MFDSPTKGIPADREALKAQMKQTAEAGRQKYAKETPPPAPQKPLLTWDELRLDVEAFLDVTPSAPVWVFRHLMRKGTVGAIVATGGSGKSRLLLHVMLSLAAGVSFGPFVPDRPMRGVYLCGEDQRDILHERIHDIAHKMAFAGDGNLADEKRRLILDNFRAVPLAGEDVTLVNRDQSGNPTQTEAFRWLDDSLAGMKPDLVVIDPLSRFHGLDENDNVGMTSVVKTFEAIAKRHGCAVLFAHHTSKAVSQSGNIAGDTGRGASALRDGVRMMLSMGHKTAEQLGVPSEGNEQGFIELHHTKANTTSYLGKPFYFKKEASLLLTPFNPNEGVRERQLDALVNLLPEDGITERELTRDKAGQAIRKEMKELFPNIRLRDDLPLILTLGVETERLEEVDAGKTNPNGHPVITYNVRGRTTATAATRRPKPAAAVKQQNAEGASAETLQGGERRPPSIHADGHGGHTTAKTPRRRQSEQ